MSKLTAMQIHITDLYRIKEMVVSKKANKILEETILETIDACIENAVAYVEKEKQQIIEAQEKALQTDFYVNYESPEDYYNETFKTK